MLGPLAALVLAFVFGRDVRRTAPPHDRDLWDWIGFFVGPAGVVISAAAGLLAVLLGWLAYHEAAQARNAVAVERRRAFELNVLLGLLDSIERLGTPGDILDNRHIFWARHAGRLAVIRPPELPSWHALFDGQDAFDVVIDDPTERASLRAERARVNSWAAEDRSNRKLYPRIRKRLAGDVLRAINARVTSQ